MNVPYRIFFLFYVLLSACSEDRREIITINESTIPKNSSGNQFHIQQDTIVTYEVIKHGNKLYKGPVSKESPETVISGFAKNGCKNVEISFTNERKDTTTTFFSYYENLLPKALAKYDSSKQVIYLEKRRYSKTNKVLAVQKNFSATEYTVIQYAYNDDDSLVKEIHTTSHGFDSLGNRVILYEGQDPELDPKFFPHIFLMLKYKFGPDKRKTEEYEYNYLYGDTTVFRSSYEYLQNGKPTKKIFYFFVSENVRSIDHYTYHTNGALKQLTSFSNLNDTINYHKYNHMGELIKLQLNHGEVTYSYNFEYDKMGNWIKKLMIKNDIPVEFTERKISYW